MGKRRLRGGIPRLYQDNRCTDAKRLRQVYAGLAEQFNLTGDLACRLAGSAARAWLEWEDVQQELNRPHKPLTLRRLKRQSRSAHAAFTSGLKTLEAMCGKRDPGGMSLEAYLARCQDTRVDVAGRNGTASQARSSEG
jgi:hypothetical protein